MLFLFLFSVACFSGFPILSNDKIPGFLQVFIVNSKVSFHYL